MKRIKNAGWISLVSLFAIVTSMGISRANSSKGEKSAKNPKWFECSSISDCTIAQGLCGDATGVNTKYLKSFERWTARRQASIRCAGGIQSIGRAILSCENSVCTAAIAPKSANSIHLTFAADSTCNDISECTVSRSVCGDPLGISWSKRKKWEKELRRRQPMVDCAFPQSSIKKAVLACEYNHCVAGTVPTQSSDEPMSKPVAPKRKPR